MPASGTAERTEDAEASYDVGEAPVGPGARLLDALRAGDAEGALALCAPGTLVSAENMAWECRGPEQIEAIVAEMRERFPGLVYEPRTRHVGFGVVVEEARVRDVAPEEPAADVVAEEGEQPTPSDHPMYDDPGFAALLVRDDAATTRALALWHDPGGDEPPGPLDLPVRVTVRHDDLQVHEIAFSFPAALLRRALGQRVDPFELSLSQVQSAFVAPVGGEVTNQVVHRAGSSAPSDAGQGPMATEHRAPRRRGRRFAVLVILLALVAAGAWWVAQGRGGHESAAGAAAPIPPASVEATPAAVQSPAARPSPSERPSPRPSTRPASFLTHARPSHSGSRKPNVTLGSGLAFGVNSATLSTEAKAAIDRLARQVTAAGLRGRIHVDGYTDSTGPAAYDLGLSQRRADAVSSYLRSRLLGAPVSIVSTGHGEADPVADNTTAAGRTANRRVTITLPRP